MRLASLARRFAPALLAALVVLASFASAAHTHAAPARSPALAAEADGAPHTSPADFGCALCAHGARLGHGAAHTHASLLDDFTRPALARGRATPPPQRVLLERLAPRAPPRIG